MADALQVLRQDHDKVKDIFRRFENTEDREQKKQLAEQALMELEVHAQIEEEIFYPAMKKQLGDQELLHEAEEEHHVADLLMAELKKTRATAKNFDAKFTVLAENVKHHIQEEEGEMFPKAAEAGRDQLNRIGEKLMQRKQELMEQMQSGGTRRRTTKTATRSRAGSKNGRSGRTTRTTARSRSASTSRSRSGGTRATRSTGTRSRSTAGSGRARASSSRARSGGSSRSRSTTKRSTAKRASSRR